MKFKVIYAFMEEYIPPRCRKPRIRTVENEMAVTIKEITSDEAPVAMTVTDYEMRHDSFKLYKTDYRWYRNKLYKPARDSMGANILDAYTPENIQHDLNWQGLGYGGKTEEERRSAIRVCAKSFLIIDGEIWETAGEPRYCIYTFGLGHNHGGTSLSINTHYNSNIGKDRYFNALQREEAIREFERIALGRGDNESVTGEYEKNIEVFIPESVKCKPNKQHGDGCPFMNKLYGITEIAPDKETAALLCMVATAREISE